MILWIQLPNNLNLLRLLGKSSWVTWWWVTVFLPPWEMIQQFVRKKLKNSIGWMNTCVRRTGTNYNDSEWFDDFYADGISDRQTISPNKDHLSTRYHHHSLELLICRHLCKNRIPMNFPVLDIGSGAGHWIDFYRSLGVPSIVGKDVSMRSAYYLKERFADIICEWRWA